MHLEGLRVHRHGAWIVLRPPSDRSNVNDHGTCSALWIVSQVYSYAYALESIAVGTVRSVLGDDLASCVVSHR